MKKIKLFKSASSVMLVMLLSACFFAGCNNSKNSDTKDSTKVTVDTSKKMMTDTSHKMMTDTGRKSDQTPPPK